MTDYAITCPAWEINALLAGAKTRISRLAWQRDRHMSFCQLTDEEIREFIESGWRVETRADKRIHVDLPTRFQKIVAGDRICVREEVRRVDPDGPSMRAVYAADGTEYPLALTPKALRGDRMPQHVSRFTLIVTSTKLERIQDATHDDIVAEGLMGPFSQATTAIPGPAARMAWEEKVESAWRDYWEIERGRSTWRNNIEIVSINFTAHKVNIFDMAGAYAA